MEIDDVEALESDEVEDTFVQFLLPMYTVPVLQEALEAYRNLLFHSGQKHAQRFIIESLQEKLSAMMSKISGDEEEQPSNIIPFKRS